jgi:hypothetical protein
MTDLIIEGKNGLLAEGNDNVASFANAIREASLRSWDPNLSIDTCSPFTLARFTQQWVLALTPRA